MIGPAAQSAREARRAAIGIGLPIGLAALALVSRFPLIGSGYGSDDDAWRNVVAALHTRAAGYYIPSRVPGFPVFEWLLVALVPLGWIATNLASVLAALAATFFLWRILKRRDVARPLWPTVGFAFGAPIWVHVSQTMDYAFGLAFFLAAYDALLRRRPALAGLLLAFATGCRPTYMLALPGAWLLLWARGDGRRRIAQCILACGLVTIALYAPVALSPAGRDLEQHFARHAGRAHVTAASLIPVARGAIVFLFGKLAALVAVLGGIAALRRWGARPEPSMGARSDARAAAAFELTTVGLVVAFYLLIPYEDAYLLPMLPVALIAMARTLPRPFLVAAMLAMAMEPLVSVQFDTRRLVPGRLFQEVQERRLDLSEARAMLAIRPESPTVFVVGRPRVHRLLALDPALEPTDAGWAPFYFPGIALRARDRKAAFAESLEPAQVDSLRASGWAIVSMRPEDAK